MSGHPHTLQHTRRICRRTDRARRAVEHRTVRCAAAAKMMSLHKAGKATALAGSHDMYQFVLSKNIDHHLVAGIRSFFALNGNLTRESRGSDIRFFEVTGHRLADALWLDEFHEAQLHGIVAVLLLRPLLQHTHGARSDPRYRDDRSVVLQQLRHTDFLSK